MEDENEFDFEDSPIERLIKNSIGKQLAEIDFEYDGNYNDMLVLKFTDKQKLVLKNRQRTIDDFILVDEDSFPDFIGAKILDVEIVEDYMSEDIFNCPIEYINFKTDKGDLEIQFENSAVPYFNDDYLDTFYEEEEQRYVGLSAALILFWYLDII